MPTLVFETSSFLQAARARIRDFVSDRGDSIGTICQQRVYIRSAPDTNADKPFIVVRAVGGESDADLANLKKDVKIEVLGVADDPQIAERLADLGEAALLTWHVSTPTQGLIYGVESERQTEDIAESRERGQCETRVIVTVSAWMPHLIGALT